MEVIRDNFVEFKTIDEAKSFGMVYYSDWLKDFQVENIFHNTFVSYFEGYRDTQGLFEAIHDRKYDEVLRESIIYQAFSFYCGGPIGPNLNEYCRFGKCNWFGSIEKLIDIKKIMENEIDKFQIKKNIIGYRTLNYSDLLKSTQRKKLKKGDVFVDRGFMGVGLVKETLLKSHPDFDTILKIYIPVGAKAIYLDLISNRSEEQEVLFEPNTKLLILSKKPRILSKKRILECLIKTD